MADQMNCGWKQVAFQLLRDGAGNAIAVCSAEFLSPDSAAVSPTMTLANPEYQMLRSDALRLAAEGNAVGACLAVYRLDEAGFGYECLKFDPDCAWDFASAATGYPVEKVAALLKAGARLDEVGTVEGVRACYEPAPEELAVCLAAPDGEAAGRGDSFPEAFRAAQAAGGAPGGAVARAMIALAEGADLDAVQESTGIGRWFLAELRKCIR